jgi:hypothetical protein
VIERLLEADELRAQLECLVHAMVVEEGENSLRDRLREQYATEVTIEHARGTAAAAARNSLISFTPRFTSPTTPAPRSRNTSSGRPCSKSRAFLAHRSKMHGSLRAAASRRIAASNCAVSSSPQLVELAMAKGRPWEVSSCAGQAGQEIFLDKYFCLGDSTRVGRKEGGEEGKGVGLRSVRGIAHTCRGR